MKTGDILFYRSPNWIQKNYNIQEIFVKMDHYLNVFVVQNYEGYQENSMPKFCTLVCTSFRKRQL